MISRLNPVEASVFAAQLRAIQESVVAPVYRKIDLLVADSDPLYPTLQKAAEKVTQAETLLLDAAAILQDQAY